MSEQPGSAKSASVALEKLYKLQEIIEDIVNADDPKALGEAFIALDDTDFVDAFSHMAYKLYVMKQCEDGLEDLTGTVEYKWSTGSYDGPISGIAKRPADKSPTVLAEYYYFKAECDIHSHYPRVYLLYKLTPAEFFAETASNDLYKKYMGGKEKDSRVQYSLWQDAVKQYNLPELRQQYLERRPAGYFIR